MLHRGRLTEMINTVSNDDEISEIDRRYLSNIISSPNSNEYVKHHAVCGTNFEELSNSNWHIQTFQDNF